MKKYISSLFFVLIMYQPVLAGNKYYDTIKKYYNIIKTTADGVEVWQNKKNKKKYLYIVTYPPQHKYDYGIFDITNIYNHICLPQENIFYRHIKKIYILDTPLPPSEEPRNQMVWDKTKTSNVSGIVVNGLPVYNPLPSFECNIKGNVVKIEYAHGTSLRGERVKQQDDSYLYVNHHHTKIYALYVNDRQITYHVGTSMHIDQPKTPIFKYTYDTDRKQYYIDIVVEDIQGYTPFGSIFPHYVKDEETDPMDIVSQRLPAVSGTDTNRDYHIKVYGGIVQPDGSVTPIP